MKYIISTILLFLLSMQLQVKSQFKPSVGLNGYLSNMQSVMFEDVEDQWIADNLFHNRLNFNSSILNGLDFSLEMRNRLMYGETVKYTPGYADMINQDQGWLDMSWNLGESSSYILNSSIDRIYADITLGKLQATIGRQRINWGMNFVWNPNDIFNSYSFFDFDYIERPGSDAIRLQYYFNSTSSFEAVSKINSKEEWSIAGLVRVNVFGADFQILTGILDEKEYVIGAGISRYIGPVSISGEITYLDPKNDSPDLESATIGGIALSYNTPFNLFVQLEYLYNSSVLESGINNFNDFYYRNMTLRDLSITPHTFFASLSYPVTPLLNLGLSGMFFPKLEGLYIGPSLDFSLRDDLDMSFFAQSFKIGIDNFDQKVNMGFLRIKWSF